MKCCLIWGMYLYMHVHIQQNERTESTGEDTSRDDRGACVSRAAVIQMGNALSCVENRDISLIFRPLNDSSCCQRAVICCHSLYLITPAGAVNIRDVSSYIAEVTSKAPVIGGGRISLSTPARLMEDYQYTHTGRSSIRSQQRTKQVQSIKWSSGWRPR